MSAQHPTLAITRTFAVQPAQVFAAWTTPAAMLMWWSPADMEAVECDIDARVGGHYRVVMRWHDGREREVRGVFKEVIVNERLVFTWAWTDAPERESFVSVRLSADGTRTRMNFRHDGLSEEEKAPHVYGWTTAIAKLETRIFSPAHALEEQ